MRRKRGNCVDWRGRLFVAPHPACFLMAWDPPGFSSWLTWGCFPYSFLTHSFFPLSSSISHTLMPSIRVCFTPMSSFFSPSASISHTLMSFLPSIRVYFTLMPFSSLRPYLFHTPCSFLGFPDSCQLSIFLVILFSFAPEIWYFKHSL